MRKILQTNPDANFFCDETPIGDEGILSNDWIAFSKDVKKDSYFWIACNKQWPLITSTMKDGNLFVIYVYTTAVILWTVFSFSKYDLNNTNFFNWVNPGLFFAYFCSFETEFHREFVDFSWIQTRIIRLEGKYADHLTITTAPKNISFISQPSTKSFLFQ